MRKIEIKTDEQLRNCLVAQVGVEVWIKGEYDSTVRIQGFNKECISVEDGSYIRDNCGLITFENYLSLA